MGLYEQFQADKEKQAKTVGKSGSLFDQYQASVIKKPKEDKLLKVLPNTMANLAEQQQDPLNLKAKPLNALKDMWSVFKGAVVEEKDRINTLVDGGKDIGKKGSFASTVSNTLKVLVGGANIAFTPITALFAGANDIPVLGAATKFIGSAFEAAGEGATAVSDHIIDSLPVSQEAKDKLKPGVGEVFALAAQLAVGKAGGTGIGKSSEIGASKIAELTKKYGKEDAKTIVVQAESLANKIPINTPNSMYEAYRKSQGYEPYTPVEQLPVIEAGTIPKGNLPTIKFDEPAKATTGSYKYEPIEEPVQATKSPINWNAIDRETPIRSDVSQTSLKVQAEARAAGLNPDFSGVPKIERMSMVQEAVKAKDFIEKNYDVAKQMIESGIKSEGAPEIGSVFKELKDKALREGNVQLIQDLAKSTVGTEAGQGLKAFDDGFRLDADPVVAMRDINRSQEKAALSGKIPKEKIIEQTKAKLPPIEKVTPKTWSDFVDKLEC